jgi:hypothetical protein
MKRSTLLLTAAIALLVSLGHSARADQIAWTYSWQRDPVSIAADTPGTGGVSLTNESLPKNAAGNSDIVATNLRAFSSALPDAPDKLVTGGAYTLSLTLTDSASGSSGTLTFTGKLSGTFSASNANITNVFDSPTTQSLKLGDNTYNVVIGPYSPPGPPSATNAGSIAAHVTVNGGVTNGGGGDNGGGGNNGGGTVQDVPEPSTMLLAGLGLSFLGGAAWRKRRLLKLA